MAGECQGDSIWRDPAAGFGWTCHRPNGIARSMTDDTDDTVSNQRQLPDPKICRTRYLGETLPFSVCLVENPKCEYAIVSFGSGFLCYHPDWRRFEKADPSLMSPQ